MAAGRYDGAVNRAYYAMFNAARTLLVRVRGIEASSVKTHSSVLRLFSVEFVRTGLMDGELGRALRRAGQARAIADYDTAHIEAAEAQSVLEAMDRFILAAARLFEEHDR